MLRRALCGFSVIAIAAPPQPGLEASGTVGTGSYQGGGCDTPKTAYRETTFAAKVRYRDAETGATGALDASVATGSPSSGSGGPDRAWTVAARGGGHFAYGGFELGLGGVRTGRALGGSGNSLVIPSGLLWLGVPEIHAFGTFAADRVAVGTPDFTVGLGHSSRYLDLHAGLGLQGWSLDTELRLFEHVAPMLSLRTRENDEWNLAVGAAFHFDKL
ncbi:MAG TPA: hypothetical protein VI356_15435 [Myxococcales bacterium]